MSAIKSLNSIKNDIQLLENHYNRQLNSFVKIDGVYQQDYVVIKREINDFFETIKETIEAHIDREQQKTKPVHYFKALFNIFKRKPRKYPYFSIMTQNNVVVTIDTRGNKIKDLSGFYSEELHATLLGYNLTKIINFPELNIKGSSIEHNYVNN